MSLYLQHATDYLASATKRREGNGKNIIEAMKEIRTKDRSQQEYLSMLVNLLLYNGDLHPELYQSKKCFTFKDDSGQLQKLNMDEKDLVHTPLIASYVQAITGEAARKRFKPGITDERPERFDEYRATLYEPTVAMYQKQAEAYRQQILQSVNIPESGDPAQVAQIQRQLQEQVNNQVESLLGESVTAFLKGEHDSPIVKGANQVLNHLVKKFDIKYQGVQGLVYALSHAQEYYYAGQWDGVLTYRTENPMNILWAPGVQSEEWIQYADWIKRTDHLSATQAKSRHYKSLEPEDIKELENMCAGITPGRKSENFWGDNGRTEEFMIRYSNSSKAFKEEYGDIDPTNPDHDMKFLRMYTDLMTSDGNAYSETGIREDHILIRLPIKLWEVTREDPITGKKVIMEFGEHYKKIPGDKVKEIRGDMIYEAFCLGGRIWTKPKPIKAAYERRGHYHRAIMPYYGKHYGTHHGTTRARSNISRARGANKMFDITLASIKRDMNSDWGNVFMMFMNMRPKDMKPDEWMDMIRYFGFMMIDPKSKAMTGVNPDLLKKIDLGKGANLAGKIDALNYWKSMVGVNLFVTDERAAGMSPYATKENVEQTRQIMHNKTGFFEETHRLIQEKALNGLLAIAQVHYRENPEMVRSFMDKVTADVFLGLEEPLRSIGVCIRNSEEEEQQFKSIMNLLYPAIQNQMDFSSAFQLAYTDTKEDALDIIRVADKKKLARETANQQAAQAAAQQKIQADAAEKQMELEHKWRIHSSDRASKERIAAIEVQKFRIANDVNLNEIHDLFESKLAELEVKLEIEKGKLDLKKEELQFKKDLKIENL